MIFVDGLKYIKKLSEIQSKITSNNSLFLIIDGDKIVFRKAADNFKLNVCNIGDKITKDNISYRAVKERKTVKGEVHSRLFGEMLNIISEPIVDGNNKAIGAFTIVSEVKNNVVSSLQKVMAVLPELFPDGIFVYMTDKQKIIDIQKTENFDIPSLNVGSSIKENSIAFNTINSERFTSYKKSKDSILDVPHLFMGFPIFDDHKKFKEIIGTFCAVVPKKTEYDLHKMSIELQNNLHDVLTSIEQLTSSTSKIHEDQKELNNSIDKIKSLSEKINDTSSFISDIANQTKMLGLNASIEAARAGDEGRDFSVVAKEIRKLSEQSSNTVPKIKDLTQDIDVKVKNSSEKSQHSLFSSEEQAASAKEISESIKKINAFLSAATSQINDIAQ